MSSVSFMKASHFSIKTQEVQVRATRRRDPMPGYLLTSHPFPAALYTLPAEAVPQRQPYSSHGPGPGIPIRNPKDQPQPFHLFLPWTSIPRPSPESSPTQIQGALMVSPPALSTAMDNGYHTGSACPSWAPPTPNRQEIERTFPLSKEGLSPDLKHLTLMPHTSDVSPSLGLVGFPHTLSPTGLFHKTKGSASI